MIMDSFLTEKKQIIYNINFPPYFPYKLYLRLLLNVA